MWWNTFPRSVAFGAIAALGLVPVVLYGSARVGTTETTMLYIIGAIAVYIAGIAPNRPGGVGAGVRAGVLAFVLGAVVYFAANSVQTTALCMTMVLAVCRSALLHRGSVARLVAVELCLGAIALGAAALVLSHSILSVALALWSYLLVQSTYLIIAKGEPTAMCHSTVDPFDCARNSAIDLMDNV